MPRVALVADDLTSAGDGAAPFRAAGFPARIILGPPPHLDRRRGVTAVDLDTRAESAAVAAARTAEAVARLSGADVLIKTVDSTVRGHLEAEIAAALSASGRTTAIIAPAFPAEGRTTVGGVQYLHGRPVHETAFAHDPGHPVTDADLTRLIPGAVAAGNDPGPHIGHVRYVIADAETDQDLDAIVAAIPQIDDVLWVGSPGLAEALARNLPHDWTHPPDPAEPLSHGLPPTWAEPPDPAESLARDVAPDRADSTDLDEGLARGAAPGSAPESDPDLDADLDLDLAMGLNLAGRPAGSGVLVLVGSLHPAARAQLARCRDDAAVAVVSGLAERAVEVAARALAGGRVVVLHGPAERLPDGVVTEALAYVAAGLAERRAFGGLVLTGGQTARTVLLALGTGAIRLTGRPEPGVTLGVLDRPAPVSVALKAGGFGDPDALVRLATLLAEGIPGTRLP